MPGQGINYRTKPNWDLFYPTIVDAGRVAATYFINCSNRRFLIIKSSKSLMYHILPWTQYRTLEPSHPCYAVAPLFDGNYNDLRQLAESFPTDLFANFGNRQADDECPTASEK